jgi:hypothetical protein
LKQKSLMPKDPYCRFDGLFWICQSEAWTEQRAGCEVAQKSPGRGYCLFLCDGGRCDNVFAYEPLNESEDLK